MTSKELRALTLVEVLAVVVCIAILALMVLPMVSDRPTGAPLASCRKNLMLIGLSFRTWAIDNGDNFPYPMRVSTNDEGSREFGAGGNMFKHFQVMSNELNNPRVLTCPADNRAWAADFASLNNSNLSYFVGLDADETSPYMILSGDRNLVTNGVDVVPGAVVITTNTTVGWSAKMHNGEGNFGLADGSVQQGTSAGLQTYFGRTGTNVNRLAVP